MGYSAMFEQSNKCKRDGWEFHWTAATLAKAATAKKIHHQGRLEWWQKQKDEVMAMIREGGIDIEESLAAGSNSTSFSKSANYGAPRVSVDMKLARQLAEAHAKVEEYTGKVNEFDGWQQVLFANPEARLPLTQGDWLYFFGK